MLIFFTYTVGPKNQHGIAMGASKPVIVNQEWQIKQELAGLGLTPQMVRDIAVAAAGARAEALPVDPCSAPGTQAYIHGVRAIRLQLLPRGWEISRAGNVESTVNHKLGVQICFQNVDRACGIRDPESISGKGSGSRNLVQSGQSELFPHEEGSRRQVRGSPLKVWLICVSSDDSHVRAEVSCPEVFEGNQFEGFLKRVFVIDESFGPRPNGRSMDDDDFPDLDVQVTRK